VKAIIKTIILFFTMIQIAIAGPEDDLKKMQDYYTARFPTIALEQFADGLYAFDEVAREQWLEIEDFPPYETAIEEGKLAFETAFGNGKNYASCFENKGVGVRQRYPYFDESTEQVVTLELAINQCRGLNGEPPLDYGKGELSALSSYLSFISRGETIDVKVPKNNAKALAAYEAGKQFYYSRRGQLDFSCSGCHLQQVGKSLRADPISTTIGHVTHFPAYRTVWGEMVTLHRRFAECNFLVRSKPLAAQSEQYRNLEYFLSFMSNGLPLNGPSSRR